MNISLALWCAITLGGDVVGWKAFAKGPDTVTRRIMRAMFLVCGVIAASNLVHALFPAFPLVRWETTSMCLAIGVGLPYWMWRKVQSWDIQRPSLLAALGWMFLGVPLLGSIAIMSLITGVYLLFSL